MTIPARIAEFDLAGPLGRGGNGTVFAAVDASGRRVALKLAHRAHDRRLEREADLLTRLDPPVVPAFVGRGVLDGRPWLAMERLPGPSLADRTGDAPADVERALADLEALADTVGRLHRAGVIHRDLKPSNVLFRADGTVALIDLGIALSTDAELADPDLRLTAADERIGTIRYMAPEQWIAPRSIGTWTDLYALGVIAFERLAGRPPFGGDAAAVRRAHVSGRIPDLRDFAPVPAAVAAAVARCLSKDPRERPDRAGTFVAELRAPRPRRTTAARTAVPSTDARAGLTAIAALSTRAPAPEVAALAGRAGATLAGVHGGHCLVAFPSATDPTAGVRRAVRFCHQLADARGVVHVAELHARTGRRGSALAGPALADPARWMAHGSDQPIHLTEAAARLGARADEPALAPVDTAQLPLRGRDRLLRELLDRTDRATARSTPHLELLLGDAGAGKTRLLEAAAQALRQRDVAITYLRATPPDEADPDLLVRDLLRAAVADRTADTARVLACLDRSAPDAAGRRAVRAVFGSTDDAPSAAPGFRDALARSLAAALRTRAGRAPLCLLVDDAHAAEPAVLDAIELATRAPGAALTVVCAGDERLTALRPHLGARAASFARRDLQPLDGGASRALLSDLLHPVEFVPAPVAHRLCAMAGNLPGPLVDIGQAIRAGGGIRRKRDGAGFYLAADELLDGDAPIGDRVAVQTLRAAPPTLVPVLELAALCPHGVDADLVRGVQLALALGDHDDEPLCAVDADAAIARLEQRGLLRGAAGGASLRSALVVRGIARRLDPVRARRLHAAVLAHLTAVDAADARRLAHHAAGAANHRRARGHYLAVAERAAALHRYVDAEAAYSAALAHADAGDRDGVGRRALAGRGRMRYRLQRFEDARDDLRGARQRYRDAGDDDAVADLLLEESTVLDWCQDFPAAAELAERAAPLVRASTDARLRCRADLALGRARYRQERTGEAIPLLSDAADRAAGARDDETRIIALLLLAPALVYADHLDDGERRFAEVIALCVAVGDRFHLAGAHINRQVLWMKRRRLDRAVDDLEISRRIAHELGNAQLERCAVFNLGELLCWTGDYPRALEHARRSRALQLEFFRDYGFHDDALLLARLACAQGDLAAREHIAWIDRNCALDDAPPSARCLLTMVRLSTEALESGITEISAWERLADEAERAALLEERVEVLVVAAETLTRLGHEDASRWRARARAAADDSAMWRRRLEAVGASTDLP